MAAMGRRFARGLVAVAAGLAVMGVAACARAPAAAEPDRAEAVFALIDERLSWMPAVAAWKHAAGAPVEDAAREAGVIERAVADGGAAGLAPASTAAFFRAQSEQSSQLWR